MIYLSTVCLRTFYGVYFLRFEPHLTYFSFYIFQHHHLQIFSDTPVVYFPSNNPTEVSGMQFWLAVRLSNHEENLDLMFQCQSVGRSHVGGIWVWPTSAWPVLGCQQCNGLKRIPTLPAFWSLTQSSYHFMVKNNPEHEMPLLFFSKSFVFLTLNNNLSPPPFLSHTYLNLGLACKQRRRSTFDKVSFPQTKAIC